MRLGRERRQRRARQRSPHAHEARRCREGRSRGAGWPARALDHAKRLRREVAETSSEQGVPAIAVVMTEANDLLRFHPAGCLLSIRLELDHEQRWHVRGHGCCSPSSIGSVPRSIEKKPCRVSPACTPAIQSRTSATSSVLSGSGDGGQSRRGRTRRTLAFESLASAIAARVNASCTLAASRGGSERSGRDGRHGLRPMNSGRAGSASAAATSSSVGLRLPAPTGGRW